MKPADFIAQYEHALQTQDWYNVKDLIHHDASVTFSTGAVHLGKAAIKIAYEKNFSLIKNEAYSVTNVRWVLRKEAMAIYLFDFFWKGVIHGKQAQGNGIGTTVLIQENEKWVLISEHLGKKQ